MSERRLGRRHAPDDRDRLFLAREAITLPALDASPHYHYWYNRFNRDQTGDTCVANGWTHRLGDSPRTWPLSWLDTLTQRRVLADAFGTPLIVTGYESRQSGQDGFRGLLYDQAQFVDEWTDTPPEGGTSVRAGAKVLQRWGLIGEYRWLHGVDEVVSAILNYGPVVIGTQWYESDMTVPAGGWLEATGPVVGGHCTVLDGANRDLGKVRVQTWGTHFLCSFDTLERLLGTDAEACIPIETP